MKKIKAKKEKKSTIQKGKIKIDPLMQTCFDMGIKIFVEEQDPEEDNKYYLDLVEAANIDWNKGIK